MKIITLVIKRSKHSKLRVLDRFSINKWLDSLSKFIFFEKSKLRYNNCLSDDNRNPNLGIEFFKSFSYLFLLFNKPNNYWAIDGKPGKIY
jgi:hypothetical protein